MTRAKILRRLEIQEQIEGKSVSIDLLRKYLSLIKRESQWDAFTNVKHHSYGTASFKTHVFYYPRPEFVELMTSEVGKWTEHPDCNDERYCGVIDTGAYEMWVRGGTLWLYNHPTNRWLGPLPYPSSSIEVSTKCECSCHCGGFDGEGVCKQPCDDCLCPE